MNARYIDAGMLKRVDLFFGINTRALLEIMAVMEVQTFQAGAHIFREGDPGDALYVVLSGEVRISQRVPNVGEEVLALLNPGTSFGEMALLETKELRSADAIAQTRCEIARLARDEFLSVLDLNRDVALDVLWSMVQNLAQRIRKSNQRMAGLALWAAAPSELTR